MLCLLLIGRNKKREIKKKKEKMKRPEGFFPMARQALLAVPHGIFGFPPLLGAIKG
jgi:hypothetical protein